MHDDRTPPTPRAARRLLLWDALRRHGAYLGWVVLALPALHAANGGHAIWLVATVCGALAAQLCTGDREPRRTGALTTRSAMFAAVGVLCMLALVGDPADAAAYHLRWLRPAGDAAVVTCASLAVTRSVRDRFGAVPLAVGLLGAVPSLAGPIYRDSGVGSISTAPLLLAAALAGVLAGRARTVFAVLVLAGALAAGHANGEWPAVRGPGSTLGLTVFAAGLFAFAGIWAIAALPQDSSADLEVAADRVARRESWRPWSAGARVGLLASALTLLVWNLASPGSRIAVSVLSVLLLAADAHRYRTAPSLFDRASVTTAAWLLVASKVLLWGLYGISLPSAFTEYFPVLAVPFLPLILVLLVADRPVVGRTRVPLRPLVATLVVATSIVAAIESSQALSILHVALAILVFHGAVVSDLTEDEVYAHARRVGLIAGRVAFVVPVLAAGLAGHGVDRFPMTVAAGLVFACSLPPLWFAGAYLVVVARRHRGRTVIPPDHAVVEWDDVNARQSGTAAA